MEPLERRYYGNERYRARERERRTRHPGRDLGYHIGPAPGGGDIALGPGPHVGRGPRDDHRPDPPRGRVRVAVERFPREIKVRVRDVFNRLRVEDRRSA